MTFEHRSNPAHSVTVEFHGKVLEPPLPILEPKGAVKDNELQKFHAFFKKLHAMNVKGDKQSVLSVWSPDSRDEVATGMTDEALAQNKSQFAAIGAMALKIVIQFGNYYICLIEMSVSGQQSFVMKYPVAEHQGELYLTNGLNRDYFYELISHYLDRSNYETLLNQ
jgi:hypothetical protein